MSVSKLLPRIIYIEGNIGSGKSTFCRLLDQLLKERNSNIKYTVLQEPVDDWMKIKDKQGVNLLERFYEDQKKYSFAFQMNSYISRANKIVEARDNNELDVIFVERSVFTDKLVFADNCYESGMMNDIEYEIYNTWHDSLVKYFNLKHYGYIYLKTDPEISHQRINKRLRQGEQGIPIEYLKSLDDRHNNWLSKETNVLNIDVSEDFTSEVIMNRFIDSVIEKFSL